LAFSPAHREKLAEELLNFSNKMLHFTSTSGLTEMVIQSLHNAHFKITVKK
jgi:hypothetical protein